LPGRTLHGESVFNRDVLPMHSEIVRVSIKSTELADDVYVNIGAEGHTIEDSVFLRAYPLESIKVRDALGLPPSDQPPKTGSD